MHTLVIIGSAWVALSLLLAPIIGRSIATGHRWGRPSAEPAVVVASAGAQRQARRPVRAHA